ncbi:VENN motif pre-toxin domain-containing protein [Pasteurella testudinis]|uniref:VENN motif pre-toxin domain-containing protein n=1 Tax=Pasteurella testudinis TaxID=761 RepID=UPI0040589185
MAAAFLTEQLYDKAPKDLTASEKETISGLSQIMGALSGVAVANNSSDGYRGAEVAKSAVENNYLNSQQIQSWLKAYQYATTESEKEKLIDSLNLVDKNSVEEIIDMRISKEKLEEDRENLNKLVLSPNCLNECQKLAHYSINQLDNLLNDYEALALENKKVKVPILALSMATMGASRYVLSSESMAGFVNKVPWGDKVVGSTLTMAAGASYQQIMAGEVKVSDVLWNGATGFLSTGTSFVKMNAVNAGSSAIQAYTEDRNIYTAAASSVIASTTGALIGKGTEKSGRWLENTITRKNDNWYKYNLVPHKKYDFISTGVKRSSMPSIFGNVVDSFSSEAIDNTTKDYLNSRGSKE